MKHIEKWETENNREDECFGAMFNYIEEFNEKYSINLDKITPEARHSLMKEENDEYLEACKKADIVEIADALGDQLYILLGTIKKHGLESVMVEIFNEIHHSNLSKLGEDGNPIRREDGKILKGPNYFPPDIKSILEK